MLLSNGRLVKSKQFADFRDVGDPVKSASVYNSQYTDELLLLNINRKDRSLEQLAQLIKKISEQGINVIISVIGMFDIIRNRNRKNIDNYIEVYIQCKISNVLKKTKKRHYRSKKDIVGIDIKPEFPKKPHIKIVNNFKKSPKTMSEEILYKIDKNFI